MQNYINMFRIGILNLNILYIFTNLLLKFLNCSNFQDKSAYWVFSEMSANISGKCRPTYRIFPEMSADIFQNAISNAGRDVVAVRVRKRNVGRHFGNVGRHLKHCVCPCPVDTNAAPFKGVLEPATFCFSFICFI